jgi:phage tail sheath protein FI
VDDFLGEEPAPGARDDVKRAKRRGLHALDVVDEIALIAVPDILIQPVAEPEYAPPERPAPNACLPCPPPPAPALVHQPSAVDELPPVFPDDDVYRVQAALVELCEARRDRFALLDPPAHMVRDGARGLAELQAWRTRFDTRHAALYHPWVRVTDPLSAAPTRLIPACGHVAGQFALHDLEIGVHRAAANRVLDWIQDVGAAVDDPLHGELNRLGVNVIRAELGRGLRILGARTLSSDPDWRYINVRRLVMMVMRAVDLGTQWVAFEPNDDETRTQVAQVLSGFLAGLWQDGALVGAAPDEAFYVRCDEANNPPESRDLGRLIAEVGLAPSVPCEFVVLRLGRQANAFELAELARGVPA